jgi:hypothetical protein
MWWRSGTLEVDVDCGGSGSGSGNCLDYSNTECGFNFGGRQPDLQYPPPPNNNPPTTHGSGSDHEHGKKW